MNVESPVLLAAATLCPLCLDSLYLPLLPIWMNMASLNPWLSEFHTVLHIFLGDFLAVLGIFHF